VHQARLGLTSATCKLLRDQLLNLTFLPFSGKFIHTSMPINRKHFRDLEYDLVVRYEHQPNHPNPWERARATLGKKTACKYVNSYYLERIDGPPLPDGKCANTDDAPRTFGMNAGERSVVVPGPLCLENGQR